MNFAQKMKRYRELKRLLDETRDYLRNHKRIFNLLNGCVSIKGHEKPEFGGRYYEVEYSLDYNATNVLKEYFKSEIVKAENCEKSILRDIKEMEMEE